MVYKDQLVFKESKDGKGHRVSKVLLETQDHRELLAAQELKALLVHKDLQD
jgi:hypothetical protein